tara:strand:+ start:843 stop:1781 length:939 start_codon:yes stop_codon:yes gene_type:complete
MSIQWYPGHMRRASNEMIEALPLVNVVIEVLDARIPFSSSNPFIQELSSEKPHIKLLNKTDLADPDITKQWQNYFEQQANTKTLPLNLKNHDPSKQIIDLINKLSPHKEGRNTLVMVTGIPNVGKSSLINCLAGKHITKTGDEPAVTKGQQKINLRNGIMLLDTPGILWPKIENPQGSYRLGTTGAIKDTAVSYEDLAFFAAEFLLEAYPQRLRERFNVEELPRTEIALLELIGAQRGCLRAGGKVDLERVSTIFINELRAGLFGPLGFETPEIIEIEMQHVAVLKAEKAEREKARLENAAARRRKAKSNRK